VEHIKRHFVAAGMCADACLHDTGGGKSRVMEVTMNFSKDELKEAKRQIDSTLHKLRETNRNVSNKKSPQSPWKELRYVQKKYDV